MTYTINAPNSTIPPDSGEEIMLGAPIFIPPDANELRAAETWRDELSKQLTARWRRIKIYDEYYRGEHRLAFASEKYRTQFGKLFSRFADNWMPIVVDAVAERLNVQGFRFGEQAGDQDAWTIWQRNQLDVDSQIAHTEALIAGMAYTLVGPDADERAQITIEHAAQAIVAFAPGSRRRRVAGLKRWQADDGRMMATVYMPDYVWKWQSRRPVKGTGKFMWEPRDREDDVWPLPNPLGVVPLVPLRNRPLLLTEGTSELHGVIELQDAVNKLVADMLIASEYGAYRQRFVAGMEVPIDEATKKPREPFTSGPGKLWIAETKDAKFGEFEASDLRNFVTGIEMLVQHAASQTRTPPHYFYLKGTFPSGESIKSAETGLVAKARKTMMPFGEGWEETMRLSFALEGDDRAQVIDAETIWADPESRSESEHVDALVKKKQLGVPDEQLQEDAGYTPQQRARFPEMLARQALASLLAAPAPAPQVPAGV